jgi:hypothetical protein
MSSIKPLDPALSTVSSAVRVLNKLYALRPEERRRITYDFAAINPAETDRFANMIKQIWYFLGSVIGTSKMLNLVNPDMSHIWDAFIQRYCRVSEQTSVVDNLKISAEYTFRIHSLIKDADYDLSLYASLLQAMEQANSPGCNRYGVPELMRRSARPPSLCFSAARASMPRSRNLATGLT